MASRSLAPVSGSRSRSRSRTSAVPALLDPFRLMNSLLSDVASTRPSDGDGNDLLLAQPRALSGEENVALDAWVRAGGHLLLFADPMMTGHSRFSIGDRRRPMDVTLLSPILRHWGLTMEFVEDQPVGMRRLDAAGLTVPVNLPGRFVPVELEGACTLAADSALARCAIGQGNATILADGAVIDLHEPDDAAPAALLGLVRLAFGKTGESAGQ